MSTNRIIGIDLGTSNTCLSYCKGGKPSVIVNPLGQRTTSSVVAYRDDGTVLVGEQARRQAIMNPARTVTAVKRLVGRKFDSHEVKSLRAVTPYEVIKAPNGDAWVRIGDEELSPPQVQAHILGMIKSSAEAYFEEPITEAIITVPAFFDETQRQSTRDAAEIAGLRACRILSESTAAALAYGYAAYDDRHIVVVDLGGGTLDVTLMAVKEGNFATLATAGDMLLGGSDFDRTVALRLAKEVKATHGVNVLGNPVALQRLVGESEDAKKTLTDMKTVNISLPFLADGPSGPINFERELSRDEFNEMVAPLVQRIVDPCKEVLREAGMKARDIDDVILVGGMTRVPVVQARIAELFERKPLSRVNPDEVVSLGAAVLGAILAGDLPEAEFADVAPKTIGVKAAGDRFVPLIKKSTALPATGTRAFKSRAAGSSIQFQLLQGESEVASKNRPLARVTLDSIPGSEAGDAVKLEVTVDAEGSLAASAQHVKSGHKVDVALEPSSGLVRSQVERFASEFREKYATAPPAAEVAEAARVASVEFTKKPGARPPKASSPAKPAPAAVSVQFSKKSEAPAAEKPTSVPPAKAAPAPVAPEVAAKPSAPVSKVASDGTAARSEPSPARPQRASSQLEVQAGTSLISSRPTWHYVVLGLAMAILGAIAAFALR